MYKNSQAIISPISLDWWSIIQWRVLFPSPLICIFFIFILILFYFFFFHFQFSRWCWFWCILWCCCVVCACVLEYNSKTRLNVFYPLSLSFQSSFSLACHLKADVQKCDSKYTEIFCVWFVWLSILMVVELNNHDIMLIMMNKYKNHHQSTISIKHQPNNCTATPDHTHTHTHTHLHSYNFTFQIATKHQSHDITTYGTSFASWELEWLKAIIFHQIIPQLGILTNVSIRPCCRNGPSIQFILLQ